MSPDIIMMSAAGQDCYGKKAEEMISDVRISEKGSVYELKATAKFVAKQKPKSRKAS